MDNPESQANKTFVGQFDLAIISHEECSNNSIIADKSDMLPFDYKICFTKMHPRFTIASQAFRSSLFRTMLFFWLP